MSPRLTHPGSPGKIEAPAFSRYLSLKSKAWVGWLKCISLHLAGEGWRTRCSARDGGFEHVSPFPPSTFILPNNLSRLTSSVGAPAVAQGRIQTSQGNLLSDCGRLGSRARRGVAFQGLILLLYFALNWQMTACSLGL